MLLQAFIARSITFVTPNWTEREQEDYPEGFIVFYLFAHQSFCRFCFITICNLQNFVVASSSSIHFTKYFEPKASITKTLKHNKITV